MTEQKLRSSPKIIQQMIKKVLHIEIAYDLSEPRIDIVDTSHRKDRI